MSGRGGGAGPAEALSLDAWYLPPGSPSPPSVESFDDQALTIHHPGSHPEWLTGVARRLAAGADALRSLPLDRVVGALGTVGRRLLDPDDPVRARALELLPATSGLSPEMSAVVLDGMAADWTTARLRAVLEAELPHPSALDRPTRGTRGRVRALGPELAFQVVSGSVPGVGATALLRSLLVKGPTLLKPGRGDLALPLLAARVVAEADPLLASSLAVVYWPGGRDEDEAAALDRADVVVAYGGDEAVGSLRRRCPVSTRFVAYHHRISVAAVGRDALAPDRVVRTASELAGAVALFDQRGCVSPQTVWVEGGGSEEPDAFARRLGRALAGVQERLPAGRLDPSEGSAIHQLRGTFELRAAAGEVGAAVHHGGDASWTVVLDPDPAFTPGCVGRVVRVQPVADLMEVPARIRPLRAHLQTVGLAGGGAREKELVEALARAGASRITGLADVPFPPPWWHHDGRGPLSVLLRWVDVG